MFLVLIATLLAQAPAQPAPAPAALGATIRMSIARIDAPAPAIGDTASAYGNFGPLIAQLLTPEGPVDIHYLIAGDESRAEVKGRLATPPAGSIVLPTRGADMVRVLSPAN